LAIGKRDMDLSRKLSRPVARHRAGDRKIAKFNKLLVAGC